MKELDAIPPAGDTAEPVSQRQIEYDALVAIVGQQAQALNDVINSANNLQARVAALENAASTHAKAAKSNGHGIIRLS